MIKIKPVQRTTEVWTSTEFNEETNIPQKSQTLFSKNTVTQDVLKRDQHFSKHMNYSHATTYNFSHINIVKTIDFDINAKYVLGQT